MNWEIVKLPTSRRGRTSIGASVGFGRLTITADACELIDNHEVYTYVQLLKKRENNRLCVGVQFLKEESPNSIRIYRRKKESGKYGGEILICNSPVLESLFGTVATAKKATRYNVEKDDAYENILVVFVE